jgi:hypothetical protein
VIGSGHSFGHHSSQSSTSDHSPTAMSPDSAEQHRLLVWQRLAGLLTPSIHRVVEFAKRLPNFTQLGQDDQLILIKQGFFECWLAHIARTHHPIDCTITFACGQQLTRTQFELMFDVRSLTFSFKSQLIQTLFVINLIKFELFFNPKSCRASSLLHCLLLWFHLIHCS